MMASIDERHLKCDCVDGSIGIAIRDQILFSFNLNAPPGNRIKKGHTFVLYKKTNKARLDGFNFSSKTLTKIQWISSMNLDYSQFKSSKFNL